MSFSNCWFRLIVYALFPVLDVGTLFLLARWIEVFPTLLIVFLSTILGLLSCREWLKGLTRQQKELRAEYGEKIPEDVLLIRGSEYALSLLAMSLFVFPGLLSDLVGYILLVPAVRKKVTERMAKSMSQKMADRVRAGLTNGPSQTR